MPLWSPTSLAERLSWKLFEMPGMNPPTEEELLLWLKGTEHSFVERKVFSDSKDWLKTVVGFANSAPVNYPAVLFIGAKDDGSPEQKAENLDSIQKSLADKLRAAYPAIYYFTKILHVKTAEILAVIVPGSAERPHFAGQSYVREGSKTVEASKEQFDALIASRNSKAYEILRWKGKTITVVSMPPDPRGSAVIGEGKVTDCNQHYVTVGSVSLPLERIYILFDDKRSRLELIRLPL